MAKVEYQFPVDKVHGRISKQHKIGFAHRKVSKLNYTTSYSERTTPYSEDEIAHQTKFAAVAKAVTQRMADPSKIANDQKAFREQSKYATLRAFIWNLEWEAYEA